MKKIIIMLVALLIGGITYAQVDPTLQEKQQQQQQELLRKQQEEQQRLMEEQQKEQEKVNKEALKEQERLMKEQAEAEKAAAKEQARAEKEAEMIAKQEKAAEKAARREAIGRGNVLTISPFVDLATSTGDKSNLYRGNTVGIGANALFHYPIAKKWNVTAGLGYRFNGHIYSNHSSFTDWNLVPDTVNTHLSTTNMLFVHNIEIPIRFERVTNGGRYLYLGLTPGFNLASNFFTRQIGTDGEFSRINEVSPFTPINNLRCDVSFGFATARGRSIELYYNLLPTYGINDVPMHQLGIKFEFSRIRFGSVTGDKD